MLGQPQLRQCDGLARRQQAHDHVFHPARRGQCGHPQFDVEGAEFFEFDFPVLRLAFLGNVQVAHDFDAGHKTVAVGSGHFGVGLQRAVDAKTDAGLGFAGLGLEVNVGRALAVGIDNDFVDKFDQFVVLRGAGQPWVGGVLIVLRQRGVGQHVLGAVGLWPGAQQLRHGLGKFAGRGHGKHQAGELRKHLGHQLAVAGVLGVNRQNKQALGPFFQREPLALGHKVGFELGVQRF